MTDPGSRTPVLRDALARIEAGSHLCLIHERVEQFSEAVRHVGLYWVLLDQPPRP